MQSSEYCLAKSAELLRLSDSAEDAAMRAAWMAKAREWLGAAVVAAFEEEVEVAAAARRAQAASSSA